MSNPMTTTEQDKELREKLTKLISQDGWVDTNEVDVDGQVSELFAIITADRKRVELEARENISKLYEKELDMHRKFMKSVIANNQLKTTVIYCNKCGAELKAQQEES